MISFVVLADQLSKSWAVNRLTREPCSVPDACIDIIGSLRFRLSFNPGAAFSSFTGGGPVLGVIAFFMTIYLVYLSVTSADAVLRWMFPVVGGGAVGNLWDRVFRADDGFLSGKVIDFIDLQFWPIFNIADIAVVGGVIIVAVRLFMQPNEPDRAEIGRVETAPVGSSTVESEPAESEPAETDPAGSHPVDAEESSGLERNE